MAMPRKKPADDPLRAVPKAVAQEFVRAKLGPDQLAKIVDSMVASALGLVHFQARDLEGKWEQITDENEMRVIRDDPKQIEGTTYRFVSLKDPDVRAAQLLMAYALDRPAEQKQQFEHSGSILFGWVGDRPKS